MKSLAMRAVRTLKRDGPSTVARGVGTYVAETRVAPLFDGVVERVALDRYNLRELTDREGVFFERYGDPEQYTVSPPATAFDRSPRGSIDVQIPAPVVCEVPDVDLIGPQALPVTNGHVVYENMLRSTRRVTMAAASALSSGRLPLQVDGDPDVDTAVVLAGPWDGNFFHFFADYLSRLEGVVHYRERTGTDPSVIVPRDPPAWLRDSLRAVGLDDLQFVEWHGGRTKVGRLVVPTIRREERSALIRRRELYSPTIFRWLSDRIGAGVERPPGEFPSRIYVSRQDATDRRVANERAVVESLSGRGFERVVLSDHSLAAQVALFADAEVVVAPHGAGLVNMMHADDLAVVELLDGQLDLEKWGPFLLMADTLGFRYGCVVGTRVGCDIRVDVAALEDLLDRVLAG